MKWYAQIQVTIQRISRKLALTLQIQNTGRVKLWGMQVVLSMMYFLQLYKMHEDHLLFYEDGMLFHPLVCIIQQQQNNKCEQR